jgi:hypothetical protein
MPHKLKKWSAEEERIESNWWLIIYVNLSRVQVYTCTWIRFSICTLIITWQWCNLFALRMRMSTECVHAHTYIHIFIKIDDPLFSFFWPKDFDWQTHAFKKKREDCYDYIRLEKCMWLRWAYLMFYLIYSRWIFYNHMSRATEENEKKKAKTEKPLRIIA